MLQKEKIKESKPIYEIVNWHPHQMILYLCLFGTGVIFLFILIAYFATVQLPEKELYFIQQIAEYVNDPDKYILFLVTLHQNFGAYARGLSKDQKQEWDKVKGRLSDVAFDEPIEQLLYLSAQRISTYDFEAKNKQATSRLFEVINKSISRN